MFKNMKLSARLYGGFAVVLCAVVVLGVVGVTQTINLNKAVAHLTETQMPLAGILKSLNAVATQQELSATQYVLNAEPEYRKECEMSSQSAKELFAKAEKIIKADQDLVQEGFDRSLQEVASAHDVFAKKCTALVQAVDGGQVGRSRVQTDATGPDQNNQPQSGVTETKGNQRVVGLAREVGDASSTFRKLLDNMIVTNQKEVDAVGATAYASSAFAKLALSIVAVVSILVGTTLAWGITRSITKPINRIIDGLNEGADQVNDAAAQVSTASQQLAEGASEQASSLEETSSALEQMAAMTRTNAENAKQANGLADQARNAAQNGDQTMHQLNEAMTGINESSEKISKIIKVIEEIAFQTNLLALNAAVEAARAGEHGKGFAVVADEVRNLAQRCAQAAKETTGLIEDAVNRSQQGTQVAGEVGKALGAIVGDVTKVSDLINGISQASQEQAQGVDQVNTAVSQMDKVTQTNAAGAEESASAAQELSAQAQTVKGMVLELSTLVHGLSVTRNTRTSSRKAVATPLQNKAPASQTSVKKQPAPKPIPAVTGPTEASASEPFALSETEDLKEF
ncbi:MAG TPA: methyl-accepting chemotaxis protein [Phycisphaerae bacterium]|nr:methyl-accepting chemotaxis protein [Phycisphaerae bacterium]